MCVWWRTSVLRHVRWELHARSFTFFMPYLCCKWITQKKVLGSQAHTLQLRVCRLYPVCYGRLLKFTEGQNILFAQFSLSALYQHRENIPIYLFFSALKLDHSTHELCSIAGNAEDIRLLRSLILNTTCQEKYVGSHQLSTEGCRMHQQENQTKHEVKFIWKGEGLIYHPSAVFKLFVSTQ